MKKVLFALLALVIAGGYAVAQPYGFSVGAGYLGVSQTSVTDLGSYGEVNDDDMLSGCYVGGLYDLSLDKHFGLALGANFQYFTGESTSSVSIVSVKNTCKYLSLSVPVNLTFSLDLGLATVSVFAGPTFDFGLSGKSTTTGTIGSSSNESETNLYEENMDRFNLSLGGGARFSISKFAFTAGYYAGLMNLANKDQESVTLKQSRLFVGISYFL